MRERRSRDPLITAKTVTTEAKTYEDYALHELRQAGYRITMPRVQVIRALADTSYALSAYAIHEKIISSGGKIDVVSVYRILATLVEVGLIHKIGMVDGYFPARVHDAAGKRSGVLVDETTDNITELDLPQTLVDAIHEIASGHGFETTGFLVEIKGRKAGKK
jgi:Fe2+ or Zn2+ uptake regulation protein